MDDRYTVNVLLFVMEYLFAVIWNESVTRIEKSYANSTPRGNYFNIFLYFINFYETIYLVIDSYILFKSEMQFAFDIS